MNTLSSLTSRSVRVFFQTPDTVVEGVPESIDSGRRNAIKAGLTGLLVVATATSAVSALAGEVDKGAGQVVETPFGKLSFAQIQKHGKKDEILDDIMTPAQSKAYIAWEKGKTQVAIEDGNRAAERKQVAINEGKKIDEGTKVAIDNLSRTAQELEKTVRATLDAKLKIPAKYRPTMENIISFGKPEETAKYFQEVLRNPNNFV